MLTYRQKLFIKEACSDGGIGRRVSFRYLWEFSREGSSPFQSTKKTPAMEFFCNLKGLSLRHCISFQSTITFCEVFFVLILNSMKDKAMVSELYPAFE